MESTITESSSGPVLFTASTVINSACFLGKLLISQNLVMLAWHCFFCVDVLNSAKLNAVHELSLCSDCSKFCLEVASSWYELEIWMTVWTQRQMAGSPLECVASTELLFVFTLEESADTLWLQYSCIEIYFQSFPGLWGDAWLGYLGRLSPKKEVKNLRLRKQDVGGHIPLSSPSNFQKHWKWSFCLQLNFVLLNLISTASSFFPSSSLFLLSSLLL